MNEMSNTEDLLKASINATVIDALERMKSLNCDDRFAVLEEIGMWIYDSDPEDNLLVPDLGEFNKHE